MDIISQKIVRPRGFVLRVTLDEQDRPHGQLSEPGSGDGWIALFNDAAELWATLMQRMIVPVATSSHTEDAS